MKLIFSLQSVYLKCARPRQHLPHAVIRRRSPSATVTTGRHPCKGSFQKIPGCCREGVRQAKLHLPALMINMDKGIGSGSSRWEISAVVTSAGNDSIKISQQTLSNVQSPALFHFKASAQRRFPSDVEEKGRKQTFVSWEWE